MKPPSLILISALLALESCSALEEDGSVEHVQRRFGLDREVGALIVGQILVDYFVVHVLDADFQDRARDVLQFDLAGFSLHERTV